jgi:hypothetical protein
MVLHLYSIFLSEIRVTAQIFGVSIVATVWLSVKEKFRKLQLPRWFVRIQDEFLIDDINASLDPENEEEGGFKSVALKFWMDVINCFIKHVINFLVDNFKI